MDNELRESLMRSMFQFRKILSLAHMDNDMHMSELAVMNKLFKNETGCDLNMTELHHGMFITKPAVSQILGALERKGYIRRDIDRDDRRRIRIKLTEDGETAVEAKRRHTDDLMQQVIAQFGEEDMREMIRLLDRLTDSMEKVMQNEH